VAQQPAPSTQALAASITPFCIALPQSSSVIRYGFYRVSRPTGGVTRSFVMPLVTSTNGQRELMAGPPN
jgi:hypothetical protein